MHLQKPNLYSKGFLIKTVSFGNNLSIFGRFSAQKAPTLQSVVHTLHTNYSTLCSACQYSAWFFVENRLVSFPELAKCAVSALSQKRANLRLPCVKGAVGASRLKDCFFTTLPPLRGPPPLTQGRRIQTPLGEACKRASHTRKSLQPLRGFRTRLGDACKHASHTCKSLYTREP